MLHASGKSSFIENRIINRSPPPREAGWAQDGYRLWGASLEFDYTHMVEAGFEIWIWRLLTRPCGERASYATYLGLPSVVWYFSWQMWWDWYGDMVVWLVILQKTLSVMGTTFLQPFFLYLLICNWLLLFIRLHFRFCFFEVCLPLLISKAIYQIGKKH